MVATCTSVAFANGKSSTHIIYDGHSDPSTVIEKLHSQNASLRATISAQNEVLKSSDNAAHAAKQRGQENAFLKNQVNILQSSLQDDRQAIKDLQDLVSVLHGEIAKRDALIEAASDGKMREGAVINPSLVISELDSLRVQNNDLREKLEKERDIASVYRAKIGEYQTRILPEYHKSKDKQVASLSAVQFQSSETSQDEIYKVKSENQVLKARIKLLEQY